MQITIQDLNVAAQLIDIAQQRGAYKAEEASAVGEVFTKLVNFVKATQEAANEAAAATEAANADTKVAETSAQ
jgi:hypothetical protein